MKYDARQIKHAAEGQWDHIHAALAPDLARALKRTGRHVKCPVHGGKDGFRLFKDHADTGGGICNTCGSFSDGLALLQWVNGWNFPQTCEAVANHLGLVAGQMPTSKVHLADPGLGAEEKKENERRRASLKRVWKDSIPLDAKKAEPARLYMARRGLHWRDIDYKVLRFHPALAYYEERQKIGVFPALIALMSDADGKPVTLHRIYLTDEGYKAPVSSPKKMMPVPTDRAITGGAIRLFNAENEPVIGVAEGIETALAVQQATGMPVWSCVSATLLEKFEAPADTDILVVWGDKDREDKKGRAAGQEATQALVEATWERDIKAIGLIPSYDLEEGRKSIDWLDVKNQHGDEALPTIQRIRRIAASEHGGGEGWAKKILNWMF